jgi:uncharacterized protein YegP (UPF0339 family)
MATATKKVSAAKSGSRSVGGRSPSQSLDFLIYGDNDGGFHWEIVAANGESLVQSSSFPSHGAAELAARRLYDGVAAAPFSLHTAGERQTATV